MRGRTIGVVDDCGPCLGYGDIDHGKVVCPFGVKARLGRNVAVKVLPCRLKNAEGCPCLR